MNGDENMSEADRCFDSSDRPKPDCVKDAMQTVPEEESFSTHAVLESSRQCIDGYEKGETRKPRNPYRSRRIPNLLSGPALIPGPVTPNFVPACSPELCCSGSYDSPIAIFPQFMLTPGVCLSLDDHDEGRATFLLEAMQKAVGLPPIVVDPCFSQDYSNRSRKGKRESRGKGLRQTPRPTPVTDERKQLFESIETDFPSLEIRQPEVATPSPKKWGKFPSKSSQLKRLSTWEGAAS
jgi:hypothetical protein